MIFSTASSAGSVLASETSVHAWYGKGAVSLHRLQPAVLRHGGCSVNLMRDVLVYPYVADLAGMPGSRIAQGVPVGGGKSLPRHFRHDRLTFSSSATR